MKCEPCDGTGETLAFVNRGGSCTYEPIKCRRCQGQGHLSALRLQELEAAEARRLDRISRDMSLREEAARLGISAVELSRLEHP